MPNRTRGRYAERNGGRILDARIERRQRRTDSVVHRSRGSVSIPVAFYLVSSTRDSAPVGRQPFGERDVPRSWTPRSSGRVPPACVVPAVFEGSGPAITDIRPGTGRRVGRRRSACSPSRRETTLGPASPASPASNGAAASDRGGTANSRPLDRRDAYLSEHEICVPSDVRTSSVGGWPAAEHPRRGAGGRRPRRPGPVQTYFVT